MLFRNSTFFDRGPPCVVDLGRDSISYPGREWGDGGGGGSFNQQQGRGEQAALGRYQPPDFGDQIVNDAETYLRMEVLSEAPGDPRETPSLG